MRGSWSSCARRESRQRGLGLIEVLIALVVVSFGVLGMAGLQLTGMRHSVGGLDRSKALLFAENLAARMRVNRPGVEDGHYDAFDTDTWGGSCAVTPQPYCQARAGANGATVPACGIDELASFDLWSIACGERAGSGAGSIGEGVIDALPGGRLSVACDAGGASCTTYTIDVEWSERDTRADDAAAPDLLKRVRLRLRP